MARSGGRSSPTRRPRPSASCCGRSSIAERFPALLRAVEGGAFAPVAGPTYAPFDFGLDLMLDGIDVLMRRQASA